MQKKTDFEKAIKTRYPEQVVIAIAKDKTGRANPVTLGWTMLVSSEPAMMAIAVYKGHYSIGAIRHSRCFTISYPSSQMAEAALFFGSHSGRDTKKFAEFKKCRTSRAKVIDSVLLDDAAANFECRLAWEKKAGDHIIFVGKVVASHINTKRKKRLYTIGAGHKMGSFT
jgi:flavin reductase (DIM6/NTAB) family NADH-FMN oxidoreductase RutF